MTKHQLLIKKDGTIAWLTPPPFTVPGRKTRRRYSEITPTSACLFVAFRILRFLFGETGRVAAWTRTWPCHWTLKVLDTGYTEHSRSRQALIEREHELFFRPMLYRKNGMLVGHIGERITQADVARVMGEEQ